MTSKERRFYLIASVISMVFHLALLAVFIPDRLLNKPVEMDTFSVGVVEIPFGKVSGGPPALITAEKPGSLVAVPGSSLPKPKTAPVSTDKAAQSGKPSQPKTVEPILAKVTMPQLPGVNTPSLPDKPVKQPDIIPEKPVKQPDFIPEKPVKQPDIIPEKPVKQPDIIPEKPVKQPDIVPEKPVKKPDIVPDKPVKQPDIVAEKPVKQPVVTPDKPVKQPVVTPDKPVKQPVVAPEKPVKQPVANLPEKSAKHPEKRVQQPDNIPVKQPDNSPEVNPKTALVVAKNANGNGMGNGNGSGMGNGPGNGSGNGTGTGSENGKGPGGPGGNGTTPFAATSLGNGSRFFSGGNGSGSGNPPTYPKNALNAGKEGDVEIRVLVKGDGSVEKFETLKLSGDSSLEKATRYALEHQWKSLFKPNDKNYYIDILFIFRINTEVRYILENAETRP